MRIRWTFAIAPSSSKAFDSDKENKLGSFFGVAESLLRNMGREDLIIDRPPPPPPASTAKRPKKMEQKEEAKDKKKQAEEEDKK